MSKAIPHIEKEIWKPVPGYEGLYGISNYGNCKRLSRILEHHPIGKNAELKEMVLSRSLSRDGYVCYTLYKNGKRKTFKAHRLTAAVFISNPEEKKQVNHKNSIKTDNYVGNLEWVNHRENTSHRYKTKETTSKYTGVFLPKARINLDKPFQASINIKGKTIYLGVHETELEASLSYLNALDEHNINNKYL